MLTCMCLFYISFHLFAFSYKNCRVCFVEDLISFICSGLFYRVLELLGYYLSI